MVAPPQTPLKLEAFKLVTQRRLLTHTQFGRCLRLLGHHVLCLRKTLAKETCLFDVFVGSSGRQGFGACLAASVADMAMCSFVAHQWLHSFLACTLKHSATLRSD